MKNAIYEYTVEAWTDDVSRVGRHEFAKKFEAGISDLRSEALEGAALIEAAAGRAHDRADAQAIAGAFRANFDRREFRNSTPSHNPASLTS